MSREEASVIVRAGRNTVSLRNCTFIAAAPPATPPPPEPHAPPVQAQVASAALLESVTFSGYGHIYLLLDTQGTSHFFSDEPRLVWDEETAQQRSAGTVEAGAARYDFLSADDEWLLALQEV